MERAASEVTGKIGLPSVLEIFKEKKLEKNIFKIGIDIPIVGVAVAGQRIGIFANISGGLDLSAGIGPGERKAERPGGILLREIDQHLSRGDALPAVEGER